MTYSPCYEHCKSLLEQGHNFIVIMEEYCLWTGYDMDAASAWVQDKFTDEYAEYIKNNYMEESYDQI